MMSYKVLDKTPPKKPTANNVTTKTKILTGKTEGKATVYIYRGSTIIGKAKANTKGTYTIKLKKKKRVQS